MFPAPAGMNRVLCSQIATNVDVSRARGDEPDIHMGLLHLDICFPRPRG